MEYEDQSEDEQTRPIGPPVCSPVDTDNLGGSVIRFVEADNCILLRRP